MGWAILYGLLGAVFEPGEEVGWPVSPDHTKWDINPEPIYWAPPTQAQIDQLHQRIRAYAGARGLSVIDALYLAPYVVWAYNLTSALMGFASDPDAGARERRHMWPRMRAEYDRLAAKVADYHAAIESGLVTPEEQAGDAAIVTEQLDQAAGTDTAPAGQAVAVEKAAASEWKLVAGAAVAALLLLVLRRG